MNAESANAVNLVSANNWGDKGYGNGGGELQGYDIYHSKTTSNSKFTLWYNSNNAFAFGDMNLYWDGNSSSANKRKYYVYKVVKQ